jgi:Zn-dependent protease
LKNTLKLGKVAGIEVSVHWTFLLLIGWVIWRESRSGSTIEEILWTLLFVISIFFCVTLHELGHALTAKRFNIKTLDITLLPIGGIARLENMPEKPLHELLVAIAGPLVNILIAAILFPLVIYQLNMEYISSMKGISKETFLLNLFSVNITLALFNMLPAFPMDGGRVFRSVLSFKLPRHIATRIAASVGQFIAILFVVGGFFVNPFLIFIGLFIFLGAQAEAEMTANKYVLSGYKVRDVIMVNYHTVDAFDSLSVPVSLLLGGQAKNFIVMHDNQVVGTLSREELIKGLSEKGRDVPVADVMNKDVVFLDADMPLENAYQLMQQHAAGLLPVMQNKQLAGTLDLENILEFIMVNNALKNDRPVLQPA